MVTTSREKTILDTYNSVSSDLSYSSSLPDRMASSLGSASLYDTVINTVADIHLMVGLYFRYFYESVTFNSFIKESRRCT